MDVPNQDITWCVLWHICLLFQLYTNVCVLQTNTLFTPVLHKNQSSSSSSSTAIGTCVRASRQTRSLRAPTYVSHHTKNLPTNFEGWIHISMDPLYHVTGFYANSTKSLYIFQNIFSTQNPTWIWNPGEYESSIWPKYADIFSFNVHSSPCIDSNHMPFPRWFEPCTTLLLKLETKLDKFEGLFTLLDNLKSIKYICNLKSTQLSH